MKLLASAYKTALGRMLGMGLRVNAFAFPPGHSPVPTPARHYIDTFLREFDGAVRGRCVEFMPPYYRDRYAGRPDVTAYDVWDLEASPGATVVGDIQDMPHLPDGRFDTILCTHVLCNVERPWVAVAEMRRLLAPGGCILCTVPTVLQGYAPHPRDFWRMTRDALASLFAGFARTELRSYGNAATASGSMQYLMTWHFAREVLDRHDPGCPSIVACAAWK